MNRAATVLILVSLVSMTLGLRGCPNHPPVISTIEDQQVMETESLEFEVVAEDPDDDPLTFSTGALPEGAVFDDETRIFSWTPALGQAGAYGVELIVSDGRTEARTDVSIDVAAYCWDRDEDGFLDEACGGDDCDDEWPGAYPGAAETINGEDDDCDGEVDEGLELCDDPEHCGRWDLTCEPPAICTECTCRSAHIAVDHAPLHCTFDDLLGHVIDVDPQAYGIAGFIRVGLGWWNKPTWNDDVTMIQEDGTWQIDVSTGGADHTTDRFALFLVPLSYDPPDLAGAAELPQELYENSVDELIVSRRPKLRKIFFSGYEWTVKTSCGMEVGPGDNVFSDAPQDLWIDPLGRLHMTIHQRGGQWVCSEVYMTVNGRGEVRFFMEGRIDLIDENVVIGLFTWDTDAPYQHYREIDIEISRWGVPGDDNAQFVVQPWDVAGNRHRFPIELDETGSTHVFRWAADMIEFQTSRCQDYPPEPGHVLEEWTYEGDYIPEDGPIEVRMNLWLYGSDQPANGQDVEVVVSRVEYVPE